MEDIKKVFGKNVRKYREKFNWSQAELAEKIDISTAFMTHIEHGTRGVSMETVECLAVVLGVPYSALFDEKPTPYTTKKIHLQHLKKTLILTIGKLFDDFTNDIEM